MRQYKAQKLDKGVGLTCTHSACGEKFIVNLDRIRELRAETGLKTIPCPYCFKVGEVPKAADVS